jgi:hypothetical protein
MAGTIRDLQTTHGTVPWRDALLPAMYDGVPFWVESASRESGRRTVVHEYPKRDRPYGEDMGQRAVEYSVRGYIVSFMNDSGIVSNTTGAADFLQQLSTAGGLSGSLYVRDYRIGRDLLQQRLDTGGAGVLQLPNMARAAFGDVLTLTAVCTRYRLTEEDRFGGYCVFEMSFVDYGLAPATPPAPAITSLVQNANNTFSLVTNAIANPPFDTTGTFH